MPREVIHMDTISPQEVARRIEKLGYTEEAERIERIYSEVPPGRPEPVRHETLNHDFA